MKDERDVSEAEDIPTAEEQEGVMMIQKLLAFGGQSEPPEQSLRAWRVMGAGDRAQTRRAYRRFILKDA